MSAADVKVVGRAAQCRAPRRRRRAPGSSTSALVLVIVLVMLGAIALAAVLLGSSSPAGDDFIAQPGPTRLEAGLPVGFAHSQEGAQAMAARFALVSFGVLDGQVSASPTSIAGVYATPGYRATLAALLQQTLAQQRARSAQWRAVRYRRAVLGTRVLSYSATQASVSTWEVVVAALGQQPPVSDQTVEEWQLEWSAGDWKLAGAPASEPERLTSGQLAEVIDTYDGRGDATPGY